MTTENAPTPVPPTGEQVLLQSGPNEVWTCAVAAGLRRVRLRGRDVLDGFEETARPTGGRGQTLVPWPNRIAGARYPLDGESQQLAVTEPSTGTAIHGLARWVTWDLVQRTESAATWRHVVVPQPGWPTSLLCEVTYEVDEDGLTVTTTATNVGDADCLYGTGSHPYLTAGTELVDAATLQLPAETSFATDDRGIPTGRHPVDGDADLREARPVDGRVLDTAYADLHRDPDGRWRARLTDGGGAGVVLWADAAYEYAQVFTGDTLGPDQRRRGVAVEPMTCPPDAFNAADPTAVGVVRLAPGDQHRAQWGLAPA